MKVSKALITAAGPKQRDLPLQVLVDRDGSKKSVLEILIEEVLRADITDIGVVVQADDEVAYRAVAGQYADSLTFIHQNEPLGYGDALYSGRYFTGDQPFLHLVGDHLWVSLSERGCVEHLVEVASQEACCVSAVQSTHESLLPNYGVVGGQRLAGRSDLYQVSAVLEKPTPTKAEQQLIVSGLRHGYYLCYFGMHVLTPMVMQILEEQFDQAEHPHDVNLSTALDALKTRERYVALQKDDDRFDLGETYGLLEAQLALALNGRDRNEVLAKLVTLLAKPSVASVDG